MDIAMDISKDNLNLIYSLRQYISKNILSLSPEELKMFENIERRLKNAEY